MGAMWVPAARLRELIRLLREMREIEIGGGESTAHAAHGVVRLVQADAGGLVLAPGPRGSGSKIVRSSLAGFAPGLAIEVDDFYQNPREIVDVAAMALVAVDPRGTLCRRRRELVPDRGWYRSPFVGEYRRRWRLDDSIYGGTQSAIGNYAGIGLFRAWGKRPFSDEDVQIAELFAEGCRGTVFRSACEPVKLSPRLHDTLRCLLAGDSAKQIASKLDLSIHTVGEYVKAVYRAHHVNSRAELMARVFRG
jgi:DNA-binding CsgD family transcriptional regulator